MLDYNAVYLKLETIKASCVLKSNELMFMNIDNMVGYLQKNPPSVYCICEVVEKNNISVFVLN